jgi:flagellar basal-body rod modification protein FlgD
MTPASVNPGPPAASSPVAGLTTTSQNTGTATSQLSANFDNFLKLLTTQLSNQDPLSPMDATQFTSQLAQFSSVEQQIKTNDKLSQLITAQSSSQGSTAVSFLGKMVEAPGDAATLTNGSAEWDYTLPASSKSTAIQILDSQGQVVRQIPGGTAAGSHKLVWDGHDDGGNQLPDGTYSIRLVALDSSGNAIQASTTSVAQVTGVSFSGGQVVLETNAGSVALGDVISVHEPQPAPPAS